MQSRLDVALARGLTPLVGRDAEVALLLESWAKVKDGLRQIVMLNGDAGIGKLRLVQMVKDHIAWYPIIDFLQRLLHFYLPGTAG